MDMHPTGQEWVHICVHICAFRTVIENRQPLVVFLDWARECDWLLDSSILTQLGRVAEKGVIIRPKTASQAATATAALAS
jgi:hypothetical protein